MKRIIFTVFCALVAGSLLGIFLLQQNQRVRDRVVGGLLTLLDKELETNIAAENAIINCFTMSIHLQRGKVRPHKFTKTSWGFDNATIKFSLLDLIFKHKVSLYLSFSDVSGLTVFEQGRVELIDHVIDLCAIRATPIKVAIKQVLVTDGTIDVCSGKQVAQVRFQGSFDINKTMKDNQKIWLGAVNLQNSSVTINGKPLIEGINGSNIFSMSKQDPFWHITLHNTISRIGDRIDKDYVMTGSWYKDKNSFILQEKNGPLSVRASALSASSMLIDGALPVEKMTALYELLYDRPSTPARGLCHLQGVITATQPSGFTGKGSLKVDNVGYENFTFDHLELKNIFVNNDIASATLVIDQSTDRHFNGSIQWTAAQQQGSFELVNSAPVTMGTGASSQPSRNWQINSLDASIRGSIDGEGNIDAGYAFTLQHPLTNQQKKYEGLISLANGTILIDGHGDDISYSASATTGPLFVVNDVSCFDTTTKEKLIDLAVQPNQQLTGNIKYSFLQQLLPEPAKQKLFGKHNNIGICVNQPYDGAITGSLELHNSKFYIPNFHNLIKEAHADFSLNLKQKRLLLSDVSLKFSKGSITTPQLDVLLGDDFSCKHLHTQLAINNILMNVKKDFYGFVYGNLLLQKQPEKNFLVAGNVVLKKALVKGDLFMDDQPGDNEMLQLFHEHSKDIDFLVKFSNEQPINIKTNTIQTMLNLDLSTNYRYNPTTLQMPKIAGTITLEGGFLKFLENKLMIEYGKIQFLTQQIDDPVIDLIAKNRINKYIVSLQITGSLQKPTILLESTPELGEEQILGLLLAGSEHASLQTDLPVMIMQNLNTILLGQRKNSDAATMILEKLSKPLKYVQITPNFTDQSGHGGVKALVSVALNKQLKAQLQKNLTLQDDLSEGVGFQVEYLVSDDINLRLMRDQRGEAGVEMELRFKF